MAPAARDAAPERAEHERAREGRHHAADPDPHDQGHVHADQEPADAGRREQHADRGDSADAQHAPVDLGGIRVG